MIQSLAGKSEEMIRSLAGKIEGFMGSTAESHYKPLDTSSGWIRLVEIIPGSAHRDVRVRLHECELNSSPKYEALSYVWAQASDVRYTIEFGGQRLDVTENLHRCLCGLRAAQKAPHKPLLLWIDAISINQEDLEDKTHAIEMMPSIYKKAERTICWTGVDLSPSTVRFIHHLSGLRDRHEREQKSLVSDPELYYSDIKITVEDLKLVEGGVRDLEGKDWQSLEKFLSIAYFSR
jgi:hypothetical protein